MSIIALDGIGGEWQEDGTPTKRSLIQEPLSIPNIPRKPSYTQLEAENEALRESRQTIVDRHKVEVDTWRNEVKRFEGEIEFCEGCQREFAYDYPFHSTDDGVSLCAECWEDFASEALLTGESDG